MQTYEYDDFTVTFRRRDASVFEVSARAESGVTVASTFTMPLSAGSLESAVVGFGRSGFRDVGPEVEVEAKATAEQVGGALADALFDDTIGPCFDAALAAARARGADRGVRLTLSLSDAPELLSVPWELLYRRPTFLASQRRTPIVRYLETGESPAPHRIEGAVRVLGIVASPAGLTPLDVDEERRRVEAAFAETVGRGLVTLEWCDPATPKLLRQRLRDGSYHVLHFVGHSDFTAAGDGVLFLEDDIGGPAAVSEAVLTTLLGDQSSLRLAILNSCEGARTTLTDPFAGIATSLVALGVPAVVAMQFPISDRAAIVFADELFTSLIGRQYPIDAAVSEARKAVFTEVNEVEWATPVLFLRAADGRLFDFAAGPVVAKAATTPPAPEPIAAAVGSGQNRRRWFATPRVVAGVVAVIALTVGTIAVWPDGESPAGATCGGRSVPEPAFSAEPPAEDAEAIEVVREYLALIASVEPGDTSEDTARIHAALRDLFPGTSIEADQLVGGYSGKEATGVRWIAHEAEGIVIVGELVYDNAVSDPCRTGFLCWRAEVRDGQISSLGDGRMMRPTVGQDEPYIHGRWFAATDETPLGTTAEEVLVQRCEGATYPAG